MQLHPFLFFLPFGLFCAKSTVILCDFYTCECSDFSCILHSACYNKSCLEAYDSKRFIFLEKDGSNEEIV